MNFIKPDVQTVCIGQAASAAAILLAAGTPGKRLALPNSRILIHQPYTEGTFGQTSDIEIQANEILRMRELLEKMISDHSGRDREQVSHDIERDKILTAEQAGRVRPGRRRDPVAQGHAGAGLTAARSDPNMNRDGASPVSPATVGWHGVPSSGCLATA